MYVRDEYECYTGYKLPEAQELARFFMDSNRSVKVMFSSASYYFLAPKHSIATQA